MNRLFLLGFLLVSFARAQVVEWQDAPYTTRVDLASVAGPRVVSVNGSTGVVTVTADLLGAVTTNGTSLMTPTSEIRSAGFNGEIDGYAIGSSGFTSRSGDVVLNVYQDGFSFQNSVAEVQLGADGLIINDPAGGSWNMYGTVLRSGNDSWLMDRDGGGSWTVASTADTTNTVSALAPTNNAAFTGTLTVNGSPIGETTPTYIGIATAAVVSVSSGSYYLDLTDWPATGSTWDASVEWDVTPELTVTGRYEFAFSAVGAKLRGRQVWPERQVWRYTPCPQSANAAEPLFGGKAFLTLATSSVLTNYCVYPRDAACPMIAEVSFYHVSSFDRTNELVVAMQSQSAATLLGVATTNMLPAQPTSAIWRSQHYIPSVDGVATYAPVLRVTLIKPRAFANNVVIESLRWRCANALEQLAFHAGWRP